MTAEEMAQGSHASLVDQCGIPWKGLARVLDEDGPFDLVIIMAGTNDLPYAHTRATAAANLRQLHLACHRHNVPTIALAPPPAPVGNQRWRNNRQVLLEEMVVELRDLRAQVTCMDPGQMLLATDAMMWDPDGLHFSQIGSYALGKSLAKSVLEVCDPSEDGTPRRFERRKGLKVPACPLSRQLLALKLACAAEDVMQVPTILSCSTDACLPKVAA